MDRNPLNLEQTKKSLFELSKILDPDIKSFDEPDKLDEN